MKIILIKVSIKIKKEDQKIKIVLDRILDRAEDKDPKEIKKTTIFKKILIKVHKNLKIEIKISKIFLEII